MKDSVLSAATAITLSLTVAGIIAACGSAQQGPPPPDLSKGPKKSIKPYADVVTKEMIADSGLFIVHRQDDKVLFEIPNKELGKELLLVSRIAKTPQIGYGGEESNTQVVRWERKYDRILLRTVSYENIAADSLPISRAVKAANFEEIIRSFPIAAYNKDTSGVVIDVTDMFTSDVGILTPNSGLKQSLKARGVDKERSFVEYAKSFPDNIEVENVLTYNAEVSPQNPSTQTLSFTMHHSMVRLPERPMTPRLGDPRVGFFSLYKVDYGRPEPEAVQRQFILRWRLEPKDTAAFLRGELVEPIKPITYYIDPATPMQWRPWLKKGVESWNEAFAEAGFKNAIRCIDPPTKEEDPDWSPEDARYSVIRYYPSEVENAYGPNIHDPRTGEILESDIGWFHNIIKLLNSWYFTQAVADTRVRTLPIPDSILGEFVAYVSAHEVGHTLGLPHNMRASNAYAVDSLRSPSFTAQYGTTPTIMDYARANYVAQPGDGVTNFLPKIGPYDKYVIKWGYRPIIGAQTSDAELETTRGWAKAAEGNKMLRFGAQQWMTVDPTAQMEDLGDDPIKATTYGIANLKRLMGYLYTATYKEGESFRALSEAYDDVLGQFRREIGHVANVPAGVEIDRKVFGSTGLVYTPVAKDRQKAAVTFLNDNVFVTPTWLLDPTIVGLLYPSGAVQRLADVQTSVLRTLVSNDKLLRLIDQQTRLGAAAYSVPELYTDVETAVFKELAAKGPVDFYRRNLQRAWIQLLIDKSQRAEITGGDFWTMLFAGPGVYTTDVRAISRLQLSNLLKRLKATTSTEAVTQAHWMDLALQIERALSPDARP